MLGPTGGQFARGVSGIVNENAPEQKTQKKGQMRWLMTADALADD